jgi:hypothetical protein
MPGCGSGLLVSSSSLLIRSHHGRRQANNPLSPLSKFPEPALYVPDMTFAEDAARIRKNPNIVARLRSFACNLLRAGGHANIKNARWRAALDINYILEIQRLY